MSDEPSAFAGRTPPHSVEAEGYLLSCCLLDGGMSIGECMQAKLPPQAFYLPANRVIFEQCCELYGAGKKPTVEMVAEELKTWKQLEAIGGYPYLMKVSALVATTVQLDYFINKVRELYTLRELIKFGVGLTERCLLFSGDMENVLSSSEREFLSVLHRGAAPAVSWAGAVTEAKTKLDRLLSRPKGSIAPDEISWGFSDMDYNFQPLVRQSVVVLAARPSVGKSSLARAIAYSVAKQGYHVQFNSLEVTASAVAANMANAISGVSRTTLRRNPSDGDVAAYRSALDDLERLATLRVDDDPVPTSTTIMAKARAASVRHPLGLVIIDYLQQLADWKAERHSTLAAAGGAVMNNLKQMARELNCVVLVLCQINRVPVREHNRRPTKADLRDSGDIEAAADVVVLLHRPDDDPATGAAQPETTPVEELPSFLIEALQDKGRDVGTGQIQLRFERAVARFRQTIKEPTPPLL